MLSSYVGEWWYYSTGGQAVGKNAVDMFMHPPEESSEQVTGLGTQTSCQGEGCVCRMASSPSHQEQQVVHAIGNDRCSIGGTFQTRCGA